MLKPTAALDDKLRRSMFRLQAGKVAVVIFSFVALGGATAARPPGSTGLGMTALSWFAWAYTALALVRVALRRTARPWTWRRQVISGCWPGHPGPRDGTSPIPPLSHWWNAYRDQEGLRYLVLLVAAMCQAIAYFVDPDLLHIAAGAGLLLFFLAHWPTRERFESWLNRQRKAVEDLRLSQRQTVERRRSLFPSEPQ
jgi:hypothetical protein